MIVAVAPGRIVARRIRHVSTRAELAALAKVPLYASLAPEPPIALALPHLDPTQSERWEAQLNREWTACGCRAGEVAAMLAIAGYVTFAMLGWAPRVASLWGHLGWATLAALIAAAVGKIVGRGRSLIRFRQLVHQLDVAAPSP